MGEVVAAVCANEPGNQLYTLTRAKRVSWLERQVENCARHDFLYETINALVSLASTSNSDASCSVIASPS